MTYAGLAPISPIKTPWLRRSRHLRSRAQKEINILLNALKMILGVVSVLVSVAIAMAIAIPYAIEPAIAIIIIGGPAVSNIKKLLSAEILSTETTFL